MDESARIPSPATAEDSSGSTEPAWAVRRAAFRAILETGAPWDAPGARDLPIDPALVGAAIDHLVAVGRASTDRAGRVTAAGGLSTVPTVHRFEFSTGSRWTSCAYDALGILGALGADGLIETRSPATGAIIRVRFDDGRPVESSAVLFLADTSGCSRPNEDWCPNVNLFEDARSASAWAEEHGVVGRVVSLEEGTDLGALEWRPLVGGLEHLGDLPAGRPDERAEGMP